MSFLDEVVILEDRGLVNSFYDGVYIPDSEEEEILLEIDSNSTTEPSIAILNYKNNPKETIQNQKSDPQDIGNLKTNKIDFNENKEESKKIDGAANGTGRKIGKKNSSSSKTRFFGDDKDKNKKIKEFNDENWKEKEDLKNDGLLQGGGSINDQGDTGGDFIDEKVLESETKLKKLLKEKTKSKEDLKELMEGNESNLKVQEDFLESLNLKDIENLEDIPETITQNNTTYKNYLEENKFKKKIFFKEFPSLRKIKETSEVNYITNTIDLDKITKKFHLYINLKDNIEEISLTDNYGKTVIYFSEKSSVNSYFIRQENLFTFITNE
jgi:hypothetical protein